MKKYKFNNEEVKIVEPLNIKDKDGTWVQIEYLTGENKGARQPITLEELMEIT
jgi:hypothetical protein